MVDLIQAVENSLRNRGECQRGERLLVAVSGGVDSVVLLQVLHELAAAQRWQLTVAHFNHQLRGRSSDADERLVRHQAKELGIKISVGRGNVRAFAARHGLSLEMAARQLRHEFLALTARRQKLRKIVLAHHADDQVELFFLRLLRGAGSDGLSGMKSSAPSPADSQLTLLRPLLDLPKSELQEFARRRRLAYREDESNSTPDFLRNRIRRELLPFLRRHYQPAIEPAVRRAMSILTAEADFIAASAEHWLAAATPDPFEGLAVAVQRRVLLHELQHLELPADFETVEALRLRPDQPVTLGPGLSVSRTPEGLLRVNWHRPLRFSSAQKSVILQGRRGRVNFGGVDFDWNIAPKSGSGLAKQRDGREQFDADAIGESITLRRWQPGDRFQPIGMKSAVKLQDLFTNSKVPAAQRRQLVVATGASGKIFWVEGLRIGEMAKLRPDTRRHLVWRWQRRSAKPSLQAPSPRASVAHLKNHG